MIEKNGDMHEEDRLLELARVVVQKLVALKYVTGRQRAHKAVLRTKRPVSLVAQDEEVPWGVLWRTVSMSMSNQQWKNLRKRGDPSAEAQSVDQ